MIAGLLAGLAAWLALFRPRPRGARPEVARRGRTDVAVVAAELSALLRAGALPPRAWELATAGLPADAIGDRLRQAARRVAETGSPGAELARDEDRGVRAVGAAWFVGERTGAPLAPVLEAVAAAVRDGDEAADARRAAMAGPVTTSRILAALPLLGLLLGQAIGVHPLQTLAGTGAGRVCAGVGLVAALAGWVWTGRLIRSAEGDR